MDDKKREETSKKRKPPELFLSEIDVMDHRIWLNGTGASIPELDEYTERLKKTFGQEN